MNLEKIPTGFRPPWDVNVIIEIPLGSEPVKYEVDPIRGLSSWIGFCILQCSIRVITVSSPIP